MELLHKSRAFYLLLPLLAKLWQALDTIPSMHAAVNAWDTQAKLTGLKECHAQALSTHSLCKPTHYHHESYHRCSCSLLHSRWHLRWVHIIIRIINSYLESLPIFVEIWFWYYCIQLVQQIVIKLVHQFRSTLTVLTFQPRYHARQMLIALMTTMNACWIFLCLSVPAYLHPYLVPVYAHQYLSMPISICLCPSVL